MNIHPNRGLQMKYTLLLLCFISQLFGQIPNPRWRTIGATRICDNDSTIMGLNADGSLSVSGSFAIADTSEARYIYDGTDTLQITEGNALVTIADGPYRAQIDSVSGAIETIEFEHHETHEGNHYFIKNVQDVTGAGTVVWLMFGTPVTGPRVHARSALYGEAEFSVEIYEGAAVSDSGTPITAFNNDRESTNTHGLSPYASPTITDTGTIIWKTITGSARNSTGVSPAFGYEIIVKRNTLYLFKIIKATSGTHYIDTDFWWYEHTPKSW